MAHLLLFFAFFRSWKKWWSIFQPSNWKYWTRYRIIYNYIGSMSLNFQTQPKKLWPSPKVPSNKKKASNLDNQKKSSWWFQPVLKIVKLIQIGSFPQGSEFKNSKKICETTNVWRCSTESLWIMAPKLDLPHIPRANFRTDNPTTTSAPP